MDECNKCLPDQSCVQSSHQNHVIDYVLSIFSLDLNVKCVKFSLDLNVNYVKCVKFSFDLNVNYVKCVKFSLDYALHHCETEKDSLKDSKTKTKQEQ